MARLILTALMIWSFGFFGVQCGSANAPHPQSRETKTNESAATPPVVLTDKQPRGSWEVNVDTLPRDSEILEIAITKVVNPGMTPVEVHVSLSIAEKDESRMSVKQIGNFSLYPPDQPGSFILNAATVLRNFSSAARNPKEEVRLVFEVKRVDETRGWTPLELHIAEPKWRAAEK